MADCSLLNLGSCLTENFFDFLKDILNSPITPFLNTTLDLLSEPISVDLFFSVWVIIIYMLSMFYALLLLYTGFNFMISGYDAAKRENAKAWLRNIVIMIVLIQASYFIYQLAIDLSSAMTAAGLSLIDPDFFLIDADSVSDIGLAILFSFFYMVTLVISALLLTIRYAFVAIGVVLFPIAIFFYYFPPMRQYGSLILNFLGTAIFVIFFDAILLIGFSKLVDIGIFGDMQVLVLIAAFATINLLMISLMLFSIVKAGLNVYLKVKTIGAKL